MTQRNAVLILDLQAGLCQLGDTCLAPALAEQASLRDVVSVASAVQSAALESHTPVVQTRLAFDTGYFNRTNHTARFGRYPAGQLLRESSPEAQIVPELRRNDVVLVTKGCVDPLVGTPLPALLAANGITDVYMGGIATNLAVESAARHSADLGLRVWIIEDMCASFTAELHDMAIEKTLPLFAEIISEKEAVAVLSGATGS